jgi:glycosyltransferase involved in cell wall biosynthesis
MTNRTRVLLVTDAIGGVWVYSIELARALKPLGIEAVLAVMGPPPSISQREQARDLQVIETGLPLDWMDTNPGDMRRAGDAIARLADHESVDIVQTSSAALLADADFAQPTIAVQHSCVASWWAAVKGTPLPHDFAWRRDLVECGLNRASCIVAPSIAFAADTARTYDLAAPVLAVHNGRRSLASAQLSQSHFVLTVGRLWDEGKNAATLDRAAARFKTRFEAAGPLAGPNGATVAFEHMHALGELGPARLAGLLAACPVFVSAALYEPFGLSALEAAHAGCALVLSDIATHREIWGGAAIFVDARDDAAFAAAIHDLLNDPDERRALGQLARARARLYTPERMAGGMADIYARVGRCNHATAPLAMAGAA